MTAARTAEWDAREYHRLANPHVSWGQQVLSRLPLQGNERVLDAGCGSGRLTAELLERLPDGHVLAVDISANMLQQAAEHLKPRYGGRVSFLQADLQRLEVNEPVDAIFSTAALHWVLDHPRLWAAFYRVLKPGGWLVAQCGGGPNIATINNRAGELMQSDPFRSYFNDWSGPWEFADDQLTADRLQAAGFDDIETDLESRPTVLPYREEYRDYLSEIVFGAHLARLPHPNLRHQFIDTLTDQAAHDAPPYMLDYWRLNIRARRPA